MSAATHPSSSSSASSAPSSNATMGSIDALSNAMHTDEPVELILLGTGTSSTLPHVDCLTRPPNVKQCRACTATLRPEGRKNKRGNTSAVLRVRGRDGEPKTIVIDVGKSFMQSAVEWFPKYGLRRIDAVLITHGHADAMNGLDDLRGWTLGGAIQSHVDIYLTEETFESVKIAFPYLVQKEFATGGGDVPEFRWHFITDRQPFEIEDTGIMVKPFAVPHGFCGAKRIKATAVVPDHGISAFGNENSSSPWPSGLPGTPVTTGVSTPTQEEFLCLGFIVQNAVTYISDASRIPPDVMEMLQSHGTPVLILDCLYLKPHKSHLSLQQSVEYARLIGSPRTYLVGFSHEVSHEEYETLLKAVGGRQIPPEEMTESVERGLSTLDLHGEQIWIRPGYDGLRVFVSEDGHSRDL
ncbi:hypothetical protein L227DRAFT_573086 [Lentinus tigrinus ALCF2SS1-6]|uniref:Metallo-beta-lactamase domain-containing protein n=1 Tax=Lentinus tigrinus ALCF2SS1-6 TaxID=1328759 RepID=A0A5C2SJ01_9APHY|nr:hypothetical protein L227DRAFT_573086 [Lentinus tigrinus ALCF2SS1-6]